MGASSKEESIPMAGKSWQPSHKPPSTREESRHHRTEQVTVKREGTEGVGGGKGLRGGGVASN